MNGYNTINAPAEKKASPLAIAAGTLGTVTSILGAYHGYKRNQSVGWAFGWFVFGGLFWPFALPLMFATGFGKPKKGLAPVSGANYSRRSRREMRLIRKNRNLQGFEFDLARLLTRESEAALEKEREQTVERTKKLAAKKRNLFRKRRSAKR
jgi:hypothetical protein